MCYVTASFRRKKLLIAEPMSLYSVLLQTEPGLCAGDLEIFVPHFLNSHSLHNAYQLAFQTCMPKYLILLLLLLSL